MFKFYRKVHFKLTEDDKIFCHNIIRDTKQKKNSYQAPLKISLDYLWQALTLFNSGKTFVMDAQICS